ncbi:Pectin lyase-like superfamily protein [Hibiscus syriacus]|uniref:Pectin lyase-like superfamily protein n=1 Tax=Hibiscus syriacus TaxID=106335 RepID=A0A6A2YET0_HIBSY|nr:Pectin lyase-like superfamily protein [Hibiscus syriacus]
MAPLVVLFIVTFLFLTVTEARFILPEQTVNHEEIVTDLPEPGHKITNVIDLPGEKTGSEAAKTVDIKLYETLGADSDLDSFPLTMTSFRPVNGHFPRHPLIPFRHKHDCHFHRKIRPSNPRLQRKRHISYGNDMVLPDERSGFKTDQSRRLGPHIQARRGRFSDDGAESKEHVEYFRKPRHYNEEREQDHDDEHHHTLRHHRRGEEDDRREGGFVKRIRKFLIKF